MNRLEEVPFLYQFQITLTPYHEDIEEHVASKKEIVNAVREMSLRLGKDRVIVRYDPILLTPKYTVEYHRRAFEKLCSQLEGYVDTIIISFVDMYKNTAGNQKRMQLQEMRRQDMLDVGKALGSVAERYAVHIQTCAEDIDLSPIIFTRDSVWIVKSLRDWYSIPWIIFRKGCAICLWLHADG